ncbi:MAG: hypothetical protein KC684_03810, partial [Candidatus Omnitrophica bacterium]|nr:hypothetical protein [Candidatus Omnitrophota bacterium]
SDAAEDKAALLVIAQLQKQVEEQIRATQPNLPLETRKQLTKKLLNELIHKERDKVMSSIAKISQNIDDKITASREAPYLLASDSYYYYQLTENLLETGKMAETKKGSKYLNPLMLAPEGHWEPYNLHPYIGTAVYKVLNFFHEGIDLMYALSFTPLLIMTLALIFFFINGRLLGCQPHHIFTASVFFLCAPIFVRRSMFGWYDNDPYNTFFPLCILACVFYTDKTPSGKKKVLLSLLIAALLCLYAHFWQGWVFFFAILVGGFVINIIFQGLIHKNRSAAKSATAFALIVLAGSFALISLTFGLKEFFVLFREGWVALNNFMNPQLSPWPDLYISVSELHKSSLPEIIALTGGSIIFTISLFACFLTIIKSVRGNDTNLPALPSIILILFFAVSLFISLGAQRFTLLFLVPLALLCALGIRYLDEFFNYSFAKILKNSGIRTAVITLIIVSVIAIPIHEIKKAVPTLLNPLFNQTWERVLTEIREKTPENSIVNSWWPPGHFIKAIAKRRVTFDGATINVPQAYWMANFFLSNSEEEALGILRMLNNSGNRATDYLQEHGLPLSSSIALLKQIIAKNNFHARMLLTAALKNNDDINNLLTLTHTTPPPSYILVYNEFVDKNLQLTFIGKWNFKAIESINADPKLLANVPRHNSPEYIDFLWKLVGGQHKYSPPLAMVAESNGTVLFEENLTVNLTTPRAEINSSTYGKGIPYSIFYATDIDVIEKKQDSPTLPYSVVIYQDGPVRKALLMDRSIAQSMLIRLFVFDGRGLKYITPLTSVTDLTKRTQIKVFKVNWTKFQEEN